MVSFLDCLDVLLVVPIQYKSSRSDRLMCQGDRFSILVGLTVLNPL
ncbi:MAG: hypothetical protein V7K83_27770 [Nostoc sp.]